MQFTMSNPGPRRARTRRTSANPVAMLYGNPKKPKEATVAKKTKKRRSAAQRAATARMIAAMKAKRAGRSTKRKARRSKRKAHASRPVKARRSSSRRRARRARRAAAPIIKRVYVAKARKGRARRKVKIEIRRVKRAGRRRARKARGSLLRTISLNPAISLRNLIAPITNVIGNLKQSFGSIAGMAGIAGGAIGAVAGGTLAARVVMPLAMRFFPTFAASPMGARLISVLLYYGSGYAMAKLLPVNDRIKRGILAGAVVAAVTEVVRPGTVQRMVNEVPFIGPLIAGNLAGIEPELGAYVEQAIAGLSGSVNQAGGAAYVSGMGTYELGAYELGDYALGCAPAAEELVSYG